MARRQVSLKEKNKGASRKAAKYCGSASSDSTIYDKAAKYCGSASRGSTIYGKAAKYCGSAYIASTYNAIKQ